MSRHIILSLEKADPLNRDQLERTTKRTKRDFLGDREGVDWASAVYPEDDDRSHAPSPRLAGPISRVMPSGSIART